MESGQYNRTEVLDSKTYGTKKMFKAILLYYSDVMAVPKIEMLPIEGRKRLGGQPMMKYITSIDQKTAACRLLSIPILLLAPLCTVLWRMRPSCKPGGHLSEHQLLVHSSAATQRQMPGLRWAQAIPEEPGSRLLLPGSPGKPSLYLALVVNNNPGLC